MNSLRKSILFQRNAIPDDLRMTWSDAICLKLQTLLQGEHLQFPMFYVSFRSEVSTHELIRQRLNRGQWVSVPITHISERRLEPRRLMDWSQLIQGTYGILEPNPDTTTSVSAKKLDTVIVPGSVFDLSGGRYGYGGGYYDRFLKQGAPQAVRIALAFDLQVLNVIPLAEHDQRMDWIITETRVIRTA
ncbi:MAG: 5-formyltetrahydrofolate cyclo-ligase [Dissulfuribacterales bacterium]